MKIDQKEKWNFSGDLLSNDRLNIVTHLVEKNSMRNLYLGISFHVMIFCLKFKNNFTFRPRWALPTKNPRQYIHLQDNTMREDVGE